MTARERLLAIVVGGLILIVGLNWGFVKYKSALTMRGNRLASLERDLQQKQEQQLLGARADRQMAEYLARSLPSNKEIAKGDYQKWLLSWVREFGVGSPDIDPLQSLPVQDSARETLYQQFSFRVTGTTTLPNFVDLLHAFYAKDYLHRIRLLNVSKNRSGDLSLTMTIDAVALASAAPDAEPPADESWRVSQLADNYRNSILNRNFFEPPNEIPSFQGREEIEAIVGETSSSPLASAFRDPEGHGIRFELGDDAPEFIRLDESSGSLKLSPDETGEFELLVRAIDDGYPSRTAEQRFTVKVNDPPPAPKQVVRPNFDDAKLTVLTALVEGRQGWTAWLTIRTQGKTEKLRVGDGFQIGSVEGKVVDVQSRYATIEVAGKRFDLRSGETLAEAAKRAGVE